MNGIRTTFAEPILNYPICELKVSTAFMEVTSSHNCFCLSDLLQTKNPYDLLKLEGFNMHLLMEYVNLIRSYGMDQYLK